MNYDFNDDGIINNLDSKVSEILNYIECLIEPFENIKEEFCIGTNLTKSNGIGDYDLYLSVGSFSGIPNIKLVYKTHENIFKACLSDYQFKNNCRNGEFIVRSDTLKPLINNGSRRIRNKDRNPTTTSTRYFMNPYRHMTTSISDKSIPSQGIFPIYKDIYNHLLMGWKTPTDDVPLGLKQTLNQLFNAEHLEDFKV